MAEEIYPIDLEETIKNEEHVFDEIMQKVKSFCKTVELYVEKKSLSFYTWVYTIPYHTVDVKMLDLMTQEMLVLIDRFETISQSRDSIKTEIWILPYSNIDPRPLLKQALESVYYFKPNTPMTLDDGSKEQIEARKKAEEVSSKLMETVSHYLLYNQFSTLSNIPTRFDKLMRIFLARKRNRGMLGLYINHLADNLKEEKKKLYEEFKEKKAIKCWFECGGDIRETISQMYKQECVQRDLLPLLEYKAKYDLLTELEKGVEEQKEENGKKDDKRKKILFASETVKKKECNRLKEFLKNNPSYNKGWSSSKENPTTDVVLCFVKHWAEQGSIEADYPVSTLVEWVVKECGVKLEGVDMKTLSNKMRDWKRNGKKIDSEIEKRVGAEFKNK